jgi:hypothetical protein
MLDMVHSKPLILTLLASAALLAGCQQTPNRVDLGPQLGVDGQHRSVVLDSSLQRHLSNRRGLDSSRAWFAARNDYSPTAEAGYRLPTVQSSVTITRDQQYHSNGRVFDQFNSTTYRSERREIVN